MAVEIAGVVLAAGAGTRLAPLTRILPKALCPVGGTALVDHALARVRPLSDAVAVNLHHGAAAIHAHLPASAVHQRSPLELTMTPMCMISAELAELPRR